MCERSHYTSRLRDVYKGGRERILSFFFFATSSLIMQKDFFPVPLGHLGLRICYLPAVLPFELVFYPLSARSLFSSSLLLGLLATTTDYGHPVKK